VTLRRIACTVFAALFAATPCGAATASSGASHASRTSPRPAAGAVTTPAQAPADIVGRWKLDLEKSDLGPNATSKPRERIDVWQREGAELHVRSNTVRAAGDTLKLDWRCREDGTAVTNTFMGVPVQTVGKREGTALHIVFTASGAFGSILTDERWTVAPDRATLTLERETKGPMGEYKQRFVFRPS
jgi:hypothetical protein